METDWVWSWRLRSGPDLISGHLPTTARSRSNSGTTAGDDSGPHFEAVAGIERDRSFGTATSALHNSPPHPSRVNRGPSTPGESASPVPLDRPYSTGLYSPAHAMHSTPLYASS